jgi:hypothetical protein
VIEYCYVNRVQKHGQLNCVMVGEGVSFFRDWTSFSCTLQVYMSPLLVPSQPASKLLRQLVDYERVHLAPSETTTLTFSVSSSTFRIVDKVSGDTMSAPGKFNLYFTNGADKRVDSAIVTISGDAVVAVPFPF